MGKDHSYDLIVAGGGLSGCAAAVSAAREGLKVLLIEKGGCLGGAACNCYVNPFMPYRIATEEGKETLISAGIFGEVLEGLEKLGGFHSNKSTFSEEILKILLDRMLQEHRVDVLFHSFVGSVAVTDRIGGDCSKDGGGDKQIRQIQTVGKSGELAFEAAYYIDATGDGTMAAAAGCDYRLGRETDHLCQPMTLCFRLSNVDVASARGMYAKIQERYKEWRTLGKIRNPREDILSFSHMDASVLHFNSTRIVKKNPLDVFDLSEAEREAREQAYELYHFLKENFEPFRNAVLLSSAPEIGIRESRMILGDYVLTVDDLKFCRKFEDGIAACNYDIDIHNPEGTGTSHYYFAKGEYYTIPYRCLLPKRMSNLLVAGRCISSDHEAQASYRIMPVCTTLGQAAGTAAALAFQNACSVKQVNTDTLRKKLLDDGAFL